MTILNVIEAEEFIRLCRGGRLYEVEKWIFSGRSIARPAGTRKSPLHIAIDMRFHSLAELLARHETQEQKNDALQHAVCEKSLEYVYLLLEHNADIKSVLFIDVLRSWDSRIIQFFLDNGADPITDSPFAVCFSERIQRALRPFVDFKAEHPELTAELQKQLDAALRTACDNHDLKWVSLLMWAGADPRSSGPTVDEKDPTNPENFTSAMQLAAYCKDVKILKRLKPDPQRDDVSKMLCFASSSEQVIKYLIKDLGAKPNEKPNGGSTALDNCLTSFGFAAITARISSSWSSWNSSKTKASKYDVSKYFDTMLVLLEHVALWRPDDTRAINNVRRNLLDYNADVVFEVIDALMKHNACTHETVETLLKTPAIKCNVAEKQWHFNRLGFDV